MKRVGNLPSQNPPFTSLGRVIVSACKRKERQPHPMLALARSQSTKFLCSLPTHVHAQLLHPCLRRYHQHVRLAKCGPTLVSGLIRSLYSTTRPFRDRYLVSNMELNQEDPRPPVSFRPCQRGLPVCLAPRVSILNPEECRGLVLLIRLHLIVQVERQVRLHRPSIKWSTVLVPSLVKFELQVGHQVLFLRFRVKWLAMLGVRFELGVSLPRF